MEIGIWRWDFSRGRNEALLAELASTLDPARTQGEHDLLAAYRALNTRQQGALLEVARGMAGHPRRKR